MALTETPICNFGWKAVDFDLKDPDGRSYTLNDIKGPNGTLIMFICNHCPYVRAVVDRMVRDVRDLQAKGIGVVAVMSNDWAQYPEDAPDKMLRFAETHGFTFPYVIDDSQEIARAYDAVCTPDFFGFNADLELQYRGRLDSAHKNAAGPDTRRELFEAMSQVAETGRGPADQIASMGCSIKWRNGGMVADVRRLIRKVGL
ncbi:MAG: thioredoxin family protein [Rhodospirillales bacterium]|nr:thioredoxin family protein [Rhodospirillales bacterium]